MMKRIRTAFALVTALVMLLCTASCSLLSGGYSAAKSYKTVSIGGLKFDVRSDMNYDNSSKDSSGNVIEAYVCDYYGMTVSSTPSGILKFSGVNDVKSVLSLAATDSGHGDAQLKTRNDVTCLDYSETINGAEYHFLTYMLDLGYRFYFVEFYTTTAYEESYRAEYEKIVATAQPAEIPPATQEIVSDGVKLTVDGSVEPNTGEGGEGYCGSDYAVFAIREDMDVSADEFCKALLQSDGGYTTKDGAPVTDYLSLAGTSVKYFFSYHDELYYYNYIQSIKGNIVYICFNTRQEANDELIHEFETIVKSAQIA